MDIILRSPDRTKMAQWLVARGLATTDPVMQVQIKPSLLFLWWGGGDLREPVGDTKSKWGGAGKFMTKLGTYDATGAVLTAPKFAPGVVAKLRITNRYLIGGKLDRLTPTKTDPDKMEQWARSRVVRAIKRNATFVPKSATNPIDHWLWGAVGMYQPWKVDAFLASRGIPGHVWASGDAT